MKLSLAAIFITLRYSPSSLVAAQTQTCSGVSGPFSLKDVTRTCNYETLLDEYTRQVFDVTGSTCAGGSDVTAKEDLDAKMMAATGDTNGEDAAIAICKALYDNADLTAFNEAADKGSDPSDLHFEQEFYNGGGEWQEEVETIYASDDRSATSVLREDAAKVREFYEGRGSYSRVEWPNALTNFDDATCSSHAAMCCWPKDRQANDGNGNCATPYDVNCVDKAPADNTDLCFADLAKGNGSTGLDSDDGFVVFPGDGDNGEGSIHCHGFAWADDEYDSISRYIGNNLFFVSMYDHMHQRGYVKNIPGMPMCGCMDQMPIATRSDCTQVDLTEDWEMMFDGSAFTGKMTKVEIDFNACRGRNNRNNDLWAYAARLYDDGKMTAEQFGKVGRVLTNDEDGYHATEFAKFQKGYVAGYTHLAANYTLVAGRDEMYSGEPHGREAFNKAFFEQSLTAPTNLTVGVFDIGEAPIMMRICPSCRETHKKVWYRRKTPIANDNFDLLHSILYHTSSTAPTGNIWNTDFTLHSSYKDAYNDANPWQCPGGVFDYRRAFVGDCSPDGTKVQNQYSIWSWFPGPRPNVAYYVNKPEITGVQDYVDSSITRADGLTDVDIGNPKMAGNTLEHDGTYHITGSGTDIWSYSDQFHFKSEPWSGDIDISVHLSSFANNGGDRYAKAGIMLRSDDSPDATYAFMQLTGSEGIHSQHRRSKGNHARSTGGVFKTTPAQTSAWLRIVKKQEKIEFYRGTQDSGDTTVTWVLHSTDTILFPDDSFRAGLAVTSHRTDYLSEATFEDYVIEAYSFPTSAPSTSSAPTSWNPIVEIGNPQMAGSYYTSEDGTIDYVKGSGTGIWGSSDSFLFYNEQRLTANTSVEMYIKKFDNGNIYSRGGLMIRDSDDAGAANAFVGAAGGDLGAVFQSRASAGASTDHHKMIYVNYYNAMWVKLDMDVVDAVGVIVTASYKVDEGDAWIVLGSTELTLTGSTVLVGQAVTAGTDYYRALETMEAQKYVVA
mmetsp:Transcript_25831/g.55583  ORF Transcript_25831/g.55583 Transcript_25831/m.55583 type:complete len:1002 (+) Transcript_25831:149-3154(+)